MNTGQSLMSVGPLPQVVLTTRTLHGAWPTIALATLPSTRRAPCAPRLPITIVSAPVSVATRTMASAGASGIPALGGDLGSALRPVGERGDEVDLGTQRNGDLHPGLERTLGRGGRVVADNDL
jgi:hypothetical protein